MRVTAEEYRRLVGADKKPSKYRNQAITVPGEGFFHSKREFKRWGELKLLVKLGEISELRRQVRYRLEDNGEFICNYDADFVYVRGGETVVEDAKGVRTKDYKIKRKLMKSCHGIEIQEV